MGIGSVVVGLFWASTRSVPVGAVTNLHYSRDMIFQNGDHAVSLLTDLHPNGKGTEWLD